MEDKLSNLTKLVQKEMRSYKRTEEDIDRVVEVLNHLDKLYTSYTNIKNIDKKLEFYMTKEEIDKLNEKRRNEDNYNLDKDNPPKTYEEYLDIIEDHLIIK